MGFLSAISADSTALLVLVWNVKKDKMRHFVRVLNTVDWLLKLEEKLSKKGQRSDLLRGCMPVEWVDVVYGKVYDSLMCQVDILYTFTKAFLLNLWSKLQSIENNL